MKSKVFFWRKRKGFTLIELLAVLLIIGILASIGIPKYFRAVERGRVSEGVKVAREYVESLHRSCLRGTALPGNVDSLDVNMSTVKYFNTGAPTGSCSAFTLAMSRKDNTECSTLAGYTDCADLSGYTITINQDGGVL